MTAKKTTKTAKSTQTTEGTEATSPDATVTTKATPIQPTIAADPTPSVTTAAKQALALLNQLAALVPFDDPSTKDLKAAIGGNRVSATAMTIAANILKANPSRFPDLDPTVTSSALEYEQALGPLVLQLTQLQQRAAKTVINRRGQGAQQTLALYQILKGLSRVSMNKATLVQQKQLEKLLKTNRKVRATSVTKKELKGAEKGLKATKVTQSKAAAAASANAEAQLAAATEALVTGATSNGVSASAPTPAATTAPAAPAATGVVTPGH